MKKHETKDIIKEEKTVYERLYSDGQKTELLDMVEDIPILTLQERTSFGGEITLNEVSCVLKNMNNCFTAELFLFFWLQLGAFVVKSRHNGFRKK